MAKSNIKLINFLYDLSPSFGKNVAASIYGYKQRKLRYQSDFHDYFQLLKKTEFYSTSQLNASQFDKIRDFLIFAFENSPYYKNSFLVNSFDPTRFTEIDDIKKLPIISKEEVRINASKISCGNKFEQTLMRKTSGTSGKPLNFPVTMECFQKGYANSALLFSWYGLDFKSRIAKVDGQPIIPIEQKNPPFWVQDYFNNDLYFSSYHLSSDFLPLYIEKLKEFQPEIIEGYPTSLYLLALANKNLRGNIRPKLIRTGSETLLDYQRKVIEDSFQCKIHNLYGAAENCISAIECKEGNLHLQLLYGYTEFINQQGIAAIPGEPATVVVTGFTNYAFPLIRYELGDQVKLSEKQECKCGRGGILLDEIIGRTDDYIITPDGRMICSLGHIFQKPKGVVNAQLLQDSPEKLTIKIVRSDEYNTESEKILLIEARKRLGNKLDIEIQYVEFIPRESNGKFKFIISSVPKNVFKTRIN